MNKIHLLIPMAGRGTRFPKSKYNVPKPFLKINDSKMYIKAINTFKEGFLENSISVVVTLITLKEYENFLDADDNHKIFLDNISQGQSETCYIALKKIPNKNIPLIISACDNSAIYNTNKFINLINDVGIDVVIWTFNPEDTNSNDSSTYSWALIDKNENIVEVHVKHKCLDIYREYSYKPIVGTFYFKSFDIFFDGHKYIEREDIRHNREFYIEGMFNYLIKNGVRIKNFNIQEYIGWGVPEDYEKNNKL